MPQGDNPGGQKAAQYERVREHKQERVSGGSQLNMASPLLAPSVDSGPPSFL